jgi:hypothetical protein
MSLLKKALTLLMMIVFNQVFSQDILVGESQSENYVSDAFPNSENQNRSSDISVGSIEGEMNLIIEFDASDENEGTADITFLAPIADSKFKRGGAIQVRWTGGNPDDEYALDLFDGRFHYRHVGELKNSGTYPWIIPKDVKPGKEYKFKLTNTNDFGEYAFSRTFVVKRKVPVAVWIVPGALIVGGAVYMIFFYGEDEMSDLPAPIEPN